MLAKNFLAPITALSFGFLLSASAVAQTWSAIDVGLSNNLTTAVSLTLNDSGQVAGISNPSGANGYFTGANGVGLFQVPSAYAIGGINNAGQVAGMLGNSHAFITGPNGVGVQDLNVLVGSDYFSYANAVNNSGQVVGRAMKRFTGTQAFITDANGANLRSLGSLGGTYTFSEAYAINSTGQVAGVSATSSSGNAFHAFVTDANGLGMRDLGTLGGDTSYGYGINDSGQVVGYASTSVAHHAFISAANGGALTDIGTLGGAYSIAYGVNNLGQVAGESTTTNGDTHAFITGANGVGLIDLNSLVTLTNGSYFMTAYDINNLGQVVAIDDHFRAYLLSAVPEPSTYTLMLIGFGLIAGIVRGRKNAD